VSSAWPAEPGTRIAWFRAEAAVAAEHRDIPLWSIHVGPYE